MIVRPATVDDAKALHAIVDSHRAILTIDPSGAGAEAFFDSISESAMADYLASPRYRFRVAEIDGAIAGYLGLRDGTHLFHLFVVDARRRCGVATKLWEEALEHLKARAPGSPITVNSNPGAVEFYRRLGFVESAPRQEKNGVAYVPMIRAPRPGSP